MEEQVTRATQAPKTSGVGCRTKFIFVLSDDKEDKTLTYHLPLPTAKEEAYQDTVTV